jgi:hypothetical protein
MSRARRSTSSPPAPASPRSTEEPRLLELGVRITRQPLAQGGGDLHCPKIHATLGHRVVRRGQRLSSHHDRGWIHPPTQKREVRHGQQRHPDPLAADPLRHRDGQLRVARARSRSGVSTARPLSPSSQRRRRSRRGRLRNDAILERFGCDCALGSTDEPSRDPSHVVSTSLPRAGRGL